MASNRVDDSQPPRGAMQWTLQVLRAEHPGGRLSTSKIAKRIGKLSHKSFHKNSIYNALRILVRRGELTMVRKGRQKMYQLRQTVAAVKKRTTGPRTPRASSTESAPAPAMLPHKLGLGEILVIRIGPRGVVTATNLHGKLMLEHHPLPG
jgi:hypothetical protein